MCELFSSFPTLCLQRFGITIDEYGDIWSFGGNDNGKCGQDIVDKIIYPPKKINLNNIQYIACGIKHTICCDYNGNIFSFGDNKNGQLGLNKLFGELSFSPIPQQINLPPIKQISSGSFFSICLSIDGDLWTFGDNSNGELGVGDIKNSTKPIKINNLSNIDYIICGGYFSYCKTSSNQYYSWGYNTHGQLGQGHSNKITIPHQCNNIPDDLLCIRGGSYHVLFLTLNGKVYSCGNNESGQLGHDTKIRKYSIPLEISSLPLIKKISCGYNHSCCIDNEDNLWVFGINYYGQLGLDHTNNISKPVKHDSLKNIIDLSHRSNSIIVKTSDNKIYAMGNNSHSQLGIETNYHSIKKPIRVLIGKEDIWKTNIYNSRAKSARK